MDKCSNIRALSPDEIEKRNEKLYKEWWENRKNDTSLSGKIPPTIGMVKEAIQEEICIIEDKKKQYQYQY